MRTNHDSKMSNSNFDPPKLPLKWIACTFVSPALVVILPSFFTDEGLSLSARVIIALALLSLLLIVSCFSLVLNLYNSSYQTQVAYLHLKNLEDELSHLESRLTDYEEKHVLDSKRNERPDNG